MSLKVCASFLSCLAILMGAASLAADEEFGPPNLLKTLRTPFGAHLDNHIGSDVDSEISPIGLSDLSGNSVRRPLAERLMGAQIYLPSCMLLGKNAEFTIKGKHGSLVAIAMADKDSGAKPILGHKLRLGADRKVVAVGKIPEGGLLRLCIETPIQGDLLGQCLYFEAALWSKPDFSDLIIATPLSPEAHQIAENGVLVANEEQHKRGLRFVPKSGPMLMPKEHVGALGLDFGKP